MFLLNLVLKVDFQNKLVDRERLFPSNMVLVVVNITGCSVIYFWKMVPNWVYFGQGEDLKLTTELSEKVQYSLNQAIKNGLNEAIMLMSINEALLSRQNFVPFK